MRQAGYRLPVMPTNRFWGNPWLWLGLGLFAVYLRGLFLDVMDVDASQYASISMEMLQDGQWLQVQHRHADYLDKPPLLFWTSALSFGLFGLHNWAYKLPSCLAALAGVFAVYRFSLLFYTKETARIAAFILVASVGVLLICNDVRADTLLMGMTACAVWQLAAWVRLGSGVAAGVGGEESTPPPTPTAIKLRVWSWFAARETPPPTPPLKGRGDVAPLVEFAVEHAEVHPTSPLPFRGGAGGGVSRAIGGGVSLALAMLAKGPIGLILPGFALGAHLLMRRDWRNIFHWRWLVLLPVIAVLLFPMCWGLYQQFDLHPEKTVNDRTGVSGLYFYFWEQSFGRITGENVWKNDTSPFYFLHVYLWAFLPWSLLLAGALWQRIKEAVTQRFRLPEGDEAYSLGAFVLGFVALSMSKYKLPHYIFITLPWAAVLTARWLTRKPGKGQYVVQYVVFAILAVVAALLTGFVFPTGNLLIWGIPALLFGYLLVKIYRNPFPGSPDILVQRSGMAFLAAAFVLNFHFYPHLLPYQSTAAVPRYARENQIPLEKLAFYHRHGHALDFYAQRILPKMETPEQVRETARREGPFWLYTDAEGRAKLDSAGVRYRVAARFGHFQVALLNATFLNPATRPDSLEPVFLLFVEL